MATVYLIDEELRYSDEYISKGEIDKEYFQKLILEGKIIPIDSSNL